MPPAAQREEAAAQRAMQFKARPYDPAAFRRSAPPPSTAVRASQIPSAPAPARRAVTKPKGPSFLTDERLNYRREVLEGRFHSSHEAFAARKRAAESEREVCAAPLAASLRLRCARAGTQRRAPQRALSAILFIRARNKCTVHTHMQRKGKSNARASRGACRSGISR
jgi:hypothetical protein